MRLCCRPLFQLGSLPFGDELVWCYSAAGRSFFDVSLKFTISPMSASLIGRLGSSTFRLSTTAVSMSLTGSRFSSDSALRPFHDGIRGRGGTIYAAALPSD